MRCFQFHCFPIVGVPLLDKQQWNYETKTPHSSYLLSKPTGSSLLSINGLGWNRFNLATKEKKMLNFRTMLQKEKWVKRERENLNAFRFGNGCGRGWGWWRGSDGRTIANSEGKLLRLQRRRRWKEGGRLDWKWENGVLGFIGRENEAVKFTRESHRWEMKCCILSITLL